jgi:hypothetical protein
MFFSHSNPKRKLQIYHDKETNRKLSALVARENAVEWTATHINDNDDDDDDDNDGKMELVPPDYNEYLKQCSANEKHLGKQ